MANSGSQMKKSCDCCKRYLDHLEEKKQNMTCFLRRMTANFRHNTIVPNKFLKCFTGGLSRTIKLESPNGNQYYVEVAERYGKMILGNGWEGFIDVHHIEENDSLLFRHIENSRFEVVILDCDGCEKVFSCAGIKNTTNSGEKSIDSIDIPSSSEHDSTESSGRQRFSRREKGCSSHRGRPAKIVVTSSSSEESEEDIPYEDEPFDSDSFKIPQRVDYVLSRGNSLTEAQKKRVLALIQEIRPETTVFVAIMHRSNVQLESSHLVISKEYAFTHFPNKSIDVTLRRPGKRKKWHPRFYQRKDNRMCILKGQWIDFVRDNHVQEGDICLFLPIKGGRKFTFMVYLLRKMATHSTGGRGTGFTRTGHGRSSAQMASAVHIKKESTEGENVSMGNDMHETSHEYLESDPGSPEYPYILPFKSCLSQSQKIIVEEKLKAIQSEHPTCVAIMTKSSIGVTHNGSIELSARFAAPYLPDRGQTVVLRCMRKIWNTKLVVLKSRRWFLRRG